MPPRPLTDRMATGALQPDGRVMIGGPRWTPPTSAGRWSILASLPPDTNVLFMTVMANGMPFVGRG